MTVPARVLLARVKVRFTELDPSRYTREFLSELPGYHAVDLRYETSLYCVTRKLHLVMASQRRGEVAQASDLPQLNGYPGPDVFWNTTGNQRYTSPVKQLGEYRRVMLELLVELDGVSQDDPSDANRWYLYRMIRPFLEWNEVLLDFLCPPQPTPLARLLGWFGKVSRYLKTRNPGNG